MSSFTTQAKDGGIFEVTAVVCIEIPLLLAQVC